MPIYDFYCAPCNTLYSFFSSTVDTEKRPECPGCGTENLERRPSRFATLTQSRHGADEGPNDPFDGLDERQVEAAVNALERELGGLDEGDPDPRTLARALRSVGESGGIELGPRMEEMLGRLEAGEDPEALEKEMTDLDDDDAAVEEYFRLKRGGAAVRRPPRVDDRLYFF